MGKPFSLQSPEQVAKEYGGNKEKIRQAMAMGLVDPTAGVLGGMFIDRMRSAQSLEQGAQPTVAQQVLAPPAPASAPAAPPASGAAKFFGAPPPMAPPMAPQAPPMGMASGGLTTLPIPDDMFDEQRYGGGGIVAFSEGDEVKSELMRLARIVSDPDASPEARNAAQKELVSRRPPEAPTPLGRFGSSIYDYFNQTPEELALGAAKLERPDLMRKQAAELSAASTLISTISATDRANNLEKAKRLRAEADAIDRGEPTSTADPAAYDPYSPAAQAELTGLGGLAIDPRRAAQQMGVASAPAAPAGALLDGVTAQPNLEDFAPPPREERVGTRGPARAPAPRVDPEVAKAVADVAAPQAPAAPEKDYAALYADAMAAREGYPTLPAGESIADQKKQDFNMALAEMGLRTAAGTSPNALVNIGAGLSGALPGMQKAMDRRREAQRDAEKADFARREAVYGQKNAARTEALGLLEAGYKRKDAQAKLAQDASEGARDRESRLEGARIGARSAGRPGETERLLDILANTPEGPARDRIVADLEAIRGPRGRGFSPEEEQYKAQLDAYQEVIKQLGGERNLNAKQAELLSEAWRFIGRDRAAAADRATDLLVKKYGGA